MGMSPTRPGPEHAIPECLWKLAISTIRLSQVAGDEIQTSELQQMFEAAVLVTPYAKTRKGVVRAGKRLSEMFRKATVTIDALAPDTSKNREHTRWKWGVVQIYKEWWEALESWWRLDSESGWSFHPTIG